MSRSRLTVLHREERQCDLGLVALRFRIVAILLNDRAQTIAQFAAPVFAEVQKHARNHDVAGRGGAGYVSRAEIARDCIQDRRLRIRDGRLRRARREQCAIDAKCSGHGAIRALVDTGNRPRFDYSDDAVLLQQIEMVIESRSRDAQCARPVPAPSSAAR